MRHASFKGDNPAMLAMTASNDTTPIKTLGEIFAAFIF